jgi:protein ImuA
MFQTLQPSADHPLTTRITAQKLHEFRAPPGTDSHLTLVILLLAALPAQNPILWAAKKISLYAPGLAWLGLDAARCIFAEAESDAGCLAALEVALRGGMTGVAECGDISRIAARRLALAAKNGGGTGFLLRHAPAFTATDSTACATRWLISPLPGRKFLAELLYAQAASPQKFTYELLEAPNAQTPPALTLLAHSTGAEKRRTA